MNALIHPVPRSVAAGGAPTAHNRAITMASVPLSPSATMVQEEKEEDTAELEGEARAYRLVIPPSTKLDFDLVFTPQKEFDYTFELPLTLAGVASYPPLRRVVHAEGRRARVRLSQTVIEFKNAVVFQAEHKRNTPYTKEIVLSNQDDAPIHWY